MAHKGMILITQRKVVPCNFDFIRVSGFIICFEMLFQVDVNFGRINHVALDSIIECESDLLRV